MVETKALISFAVTAKLICVFVFAYTDCWFSCAVAQIQPGKICFMTIFSEVMFRSQLMMLYPWATCCFMSWCLKNVTEWPPIGKIAAHFLFAITATGVVPCGGPKKSPRTSSIVQIIFFF